MSSSADSISPAAHPTASIATDQPEPSLSPHDQRLLQKLRFACLSALVSVALLTIFTYAIQSRRIEGQAESSVIVAISGNQRMLSQRVTLLTLSLMSTSDPVLRGRIKGSLSQAVQAMEAAHQQLVGADGVLTLPMSEAIRAMYFDEPVSLDRRVKTFISEVRGLIAAPESEYTLDNRHLRYITSSSTDLLNDLGRLTEQYSLEGKEGIYSLERTARLLLFITIVVLSLTFGLIFRPMLRRLCQEFLRRQESRQQLRAAADRLEHYANELESSNQELEQFANIVAHDLRAPLRTVMGFADCLKQKLEGVEDPETAEFVDFIYTAARRMDRLIYDLLQFSRVTSSELQVEEIVLDEVLEEILADLSLEIEQKGAVIRCSSLPKVEGNRTQIRQLFQNLIHNSIKFAKEGEVLKVRVYAAPCDAETVNIVVEDNGIGFAQEDAERIFQIFRRLHSETEYEGSGVGLAICQKIVQKHRGSIKAESSKNNGARFTITLPRRSMGAIVIERPAPLPAENIALQ